MIEKKHLSLFIVLMLLASLAMISVPVQSSPSPATFEVEMPPEGYIPGKPVGTEFMVNISVDANELADDSVEGMVGWGLDVQVDPDVLVPINATGADRGYFLFDFLAEYGYDYEYSVSLQSGTINNATGYFNEVVELIVATPPKGAGGNGTLVSIFFKSLSETAYTPINISLYQGGDWQASYRNTTGQWTDVATIDGHYNPPWLYLHSDSGLIDLESPVTTSWDELYPTYGNSYSLIGWQDNDTDGNLSYPDKVEVQRGGSSEWYRVRNVTVTLNTKDKVEATTTRNASSTSGDWTNGTDAYADGGENASVASPGGPYLWISGGDDTVRKFEADYPTTEILSWDTGTAESPFGIEFRTIGVNDYVYVVDYTDDVVARYDADTGAGFTIWDISGFSSNGYGLAWNGSKWFIADRGADLIYVADWGDTSADMSFTYSGIGYMEGITCNGTFAWTTDTNDNVYKLEIPTSGFGVTASINASWDFAPNDPVGITYDSTLDRLWIVSSATDKLYRYNATGDQEAEFVLPTSAPEGVAYQQTVEAPKTQKYGGYGYDIHNLPTSATNIKVRVRLDASTAGNENITLKVSTNGGTQWLPYDWNQTLTTSEVSYWANVTLWTSWTPAKINDDKIWVQVRPITNGALDDVYLDYIAIEVKYIAYYYIEFKGDIHDFPWTTPTGTLWHELYPLINNNYNLTYWTDDTSGNLTVGDDINLNDTLTGDIVSHYVLDVATDIVLEGPIPEPPSLPEFPLGLALEIGLIVAIAYVWWRRRRKTKITRHAKLAHSHGISKPATTPKHA